MTNIDDLRSRQRFTRPLHQQLFGLDHIGIFAGHAESLTPILVDKVNNVLIDQPAKHHFDDIHGGAVGDAHTVNKVRSNTQLLEQRANLRTSAMHHDGVHSHQLHQHNIPRKAILQGLVGHGIAAVLDHEGFPLKPLDIRERLGQNGCDLERLLP